MKISEDLIITPTLLKRFIAEATLDGGDGRHYAVVRRDNGDLLVHYPGSPLIVPEQLFWANSLLFGLNRELHHDGAWVLVFTNPLPRIVDNVLLDIPHVEYGRYCLIWLDSDGDPQFSQEWIAGEGALRTFADVMLAGIHSTMVKCETSWQLWKTMMRDVLDPHPDQLFKAAQGQPIPSTRH